MSCCWCSGSSRNPEPLKRVAQPRVVVLTIIYSNHAKSVFATSFFAAKDLPSEVQHCDTILAMILLAVQKGNNIPVRKSSVPRSVLRLGTDNAKQFSTIIIMRSLLAMGSLCVMSIAASHQAEDEGWVMVSPAN